MERTWRSLISQERDSAVQGSTCSYVTRIHEFVNPMVI
jgi:hypothetical protein